MILSRFALGEQTPVLKLVLLGRVLLAPRTFATSTAEPKVCAQRNFNYHFIHDVSECQLMRARSITLLPGCRDHRRWSCGVCCSHQGWAARLEGSMCGGTGITWRDVPERGMHSLEGMQPDQGSPGSSVRPSSHPFKNRATCTCIRQDVEACAHKPSDALGLFSCRTLSSGIAHFNCHQYAWHALLYHNQLHNHEVFSTPRTSWLDTHLLMIHG